MDENMRTTIDIDDDVLIAARKIARTRGISLSKVLSDLARQTLSQQNAFAIRNGVPLFPVQHNARAVTSELVYQLQEDIERIP
jgi:hypothetical protein